MADERPIDGNGWGAWNSGAFERWQVVARSWAVFVRNTDELVGLLNLPATNLLVSLELMNDDQATGAPFWDELDQRLHNQLSSAATLVDHTRRLTDHYAADLPHLAREFETLNKAVIAMDEAAFLRRLRNYLLHYGAAPIVQTLSLGPSPEDGGTGHSIKLGAQHLLKWDRWNAQDRKYLESFADRDGPVIGPVVAAYANAMGQLYHWLFGQRAEALRTPPDRFRISHDRPEA